MGLGRRQRRKLQDLPWTIGRVKKKGKRITRAIVKKDQRSNDREAITGCRSSAVSQGEAALLGQV